MPSYINYNYFTNNSFQVAASSISGLVLSVVKTISDILTFENIKAKARFFNLKAFREVLFFIFRATGTETVKKRVLPPYTKQVL